MSGSALWLAPIFKDGWSLFQEELCAHYKTEAWSFRPKEEKTFF